MLPALRRLAPLALALAACALLVVAEFTTLYSIRAITVTLDETTVGGHHGYALLVIALAAAVMAVGATRGGSRPAAVAVLVLAAAALVVVLAVDLPALDETGLYGRDYEQARAEAEIGFFLSSAGAVLLLFSAVSILVATRFRDDASGKRPRESERGASVETPTSAT